MIISHKYKYIFIQFPHTACTAVAKELVEFYSGEHILEKHSMFHHLKEKFGSTYDDYYVFSTIRDPIDEMVSVYHKFKTNHENYSDPRKWRENGGIYSKRGLGQFRFIYYENASFEEYLKRFFKIPYVNWTILSHKKFNYVMKFENLQYDFSQVLNELNISQVRKIPVVNKTKGKARPNEFARAKFRKQVVWSLGPLTDYWNYDFPNEWGNKLKVPLLSKLLFRMHMLVRVLYWRYYLKDTL